VLVRVLVRVLAQERVLVRVLAQERVLVRVLAQERVLERVQAQEPPPGLVQVRGQAWPPLPRELGWISWRTEWRGQE
jgi:hypothetical protein